MILSVVVDSNERTILQRQANVCTLHSASEISSGINETIEAEMKEVKYTISAPDLPPGTTINLAPIFGGIRKADTVGFNRLLVFVRTSL